MDPHDTIVQSASAGDEVAIDVLLERHLPGVEAYVRLNAGRVLEARESQADIVQSVCREVLEGMDGVTYRGEAAFRAWLFRVAESKLIDRSRFWQRERRDHRREQRPRTAACGEVGQDRFEALRASLPSPSQHAIAREELERLERAFARLSEEHRRVVLMARVVGYSHREIARELERSEAATRMLLHRALARLGELMGEDEAAG